METRRLAHGWTEDRAGSRHGTWCGMILAFSVINQKQNNY